MVVVDEGMTEEGPAFGYCPEEAADILYRAQLRYGLVRIVERLKP
jgi:hypothetical protein